MDQLFLLNPNFNDDRIGKINQLYYCPFNAMIEGVLKYFPKIREELNITYVDFPRPRKAIIQILGEEHQGTPLLIIEREDVQLNSLNIQTANGRKFLHGSSEIAEYFSRAFGIALPHP